MRRSRRSVLRASGVALACLTAGCGYETAASGVTEHSDDIPGSGGGSTAAATRSPSERGESEPASTPASPMPRPPGPHLYDDFESGSIADAYVGDRDQYEVIWDGIDGEHAIEVGESRAALTHAEASTPRRCEYRAAVRVAGAPNLRVNVQDAETPRDPGCYSVQLHAGEDVVRLYKVVEDTDVLLDSVEYSIDRGDVLVPRMRIGSETVQLVVDDADGTEIGRTDVVEDTTYEGGTFGLHTYGPPGSAWDDVRRIPL